MSARIQRRRVKGWRAPEGAVYVGRGSKWGNPFVVGEVYASRTAFHNCPDPFVGIRKQGTYEHAAWSPWPAWTETITVVRDRAHAVALFREYVTYHDDEWSPAVVRELAGRDLMCWCPPDQPCHADVLLALANPTPSTTPEEGDHHA